MIGRPFPRNNLRCCFGLPSNSRTLSSLLQNSKLQFYRERRHTGLPRLTFEPVLERLYARSRAIALLDLQTRLQRATLDEQTLVSEFLAVSSPDDTDVGVELHQYSDNKERLRKAALTIIDGRFRTLNELTIPNLETSVGT